MSITQPARHITALFSIATLILVSSCVEDRPPCQTIDSRELARLAPNRSDELQFTTSSGLQFLANEVKINPPPQELYWINVRRHTGNSCAPLQLQNAEVANVPGIRFNPSPEELYQGAFILERIKFCMHKPINLCADMPTVVNNFDKSDAVIEMSERDPRALSNCSPATLEPLWPQFKAEPSQKKVIACLKDNKNKERVMQFSYQDIGEDEQRLLLEDIYSN